jgi:hypothetical protein
VTDSGILTTASDLLFTGGREGYFTRSTRERDAAVEASLGGQIVMAPITYEVDGKQYVSVIAGNTLVTFGLRDDAPRVMSRPMWRGLQPPRRDTPSCVRGPFRAASAAESPALTSTQDRPR